MKVSSLECAASAPSVLLPKLTPAPAPALSLGHAGSKSKSYTFGDAFAELLKKLKASRFHTIPRVVYRAPIELAEQYKKMSNTQSQTQTQTQTSQNSYPSVSVFLVSPPPLFSSLLSRSVSQSLLILDLARHSRTSELSFVLCKTTAAGNLNINNEREHQLIMKT